MSTPTNSFPAAGSFALTDTFMMNVAGASSKVTGTNAITSLGVPTLAAVNTFTAATNVFSNSGNLITLNPGNGAGGIIQFTGNGNNATIGTNGNFQISVATASPIQILTSGASQFFFGDGQGTPAAQLTTTSTGLFGWSSGAVANNSKDTALTRAAANIVEVDDGTAGAGHGGGINFPQRAADADAPAPASGATLYSKQVGGKNALFVRFPTGIVQQLAIEL